MSFFNKLISNPANIISIIVIVFALVSSVFAYSKYKKMKSKIFSLNLEVQRKKEQIRIAENKIVTSSETISKKEFEDEIRKWAAKDRERQDLIKALREKKQEIITITKTKVQVVNKIVYRDKPSDNINLGIHYKKLLTKEGLKLADVSFNTKKIKSPWSYTVSPLKLKMTILQAVSPSGPDRIGLTAVLVDEKGKKSKVKIEDTQTKYTYPKKKIPKWKFSVSPFTLELTALAGLDVNNLKFSGGFTVGTHIFKLKYGDQPDSWRFLGLGVGYSSPNNLLFTIYPASYNVGNHIPIFRDLYLTVGIGLGLAFPGPNVNYFIQAGLMTTL